MTRGDPISLPDAGKPIAHRHADVARPPCARFTGSSPARATLPADRSPAMAPRKGHDTRRRHLCGCLRDTRRPAPKKRGSSRKSCPSRPPAGSVHSPLWRRRLLKRDRAQNTATRKCRQKRRAPAETAGTGRNGRHRQKRQAPADMKKAALPDDPVRAAKRQTLFRPQRHQTLQDVDGIGQLVILLAQFGCFLGLLAVFLDLADLVFAEAVIVQAAAQIRFGTGTAG